MILQLTFPQLLNEPLLAQTSANSKDRLRGVMTEENAESSLKAFIDSFISRAKKQVLIFQTPEVTFTDFDSAGMASGHPPIARESYRHYIDKIAIHDFDR